MGYTTDFSGSFQLDKPLASEHQAFLVKFAGTRRMQRDADITSEREDPVREATGLPVGEEGAYFVGEGGFAGQGESGFGSRPEDVINYNAPPEGQPGLWCQWVPNEEGTEIRWDGGEKFYSYVEWLEYLITHFLTPWGYVLNGKVEWLGEERSDIGRIVVENNEVTTAPGFLEWR
ncbi:hypothetical protein CMI37_16495 [Candidatus Pacearchaeota archaeon]|nr:hypothetical protein [Candidatus Pacearchaeota archaeon]|tara:strand:- start:2800 stop:3324 length:525 start_codon:yes stop_codon:yes gene_type:complete